MDTLDRCIRDLIPARPKRSGLIGRRFGVEVPGSPGVAARLKRRRRTSPDARGEAPREYGSWLLRGSLCLPMFPVCQRTNSRFANSSVPGASRCRSNAPRLSRDEDGIGMGTTRNGYLTTELAAARPGSSPRTLERYRHRARDGGPPCVSCCDRVRDLRSDLEELIARDGRPVGVGSEDECGRDGHGMDAGKINLSVSNLRNGRTRADIRGNKRTKKGDKHM